MSQLLLVLVSCYLTTPVSSEMITTGVGLLTNRSVKESDSGCVLLKQQAEEAWKFGGIYKCISLHPSLFGLDWQIIPYHISVKTEEFHNFPVHGHYFEKYDFINKKLNAPGKKCVTVTGSDWWIAQTLHNMSYDISMFYTTHIGILNPSVCRKLKNLTYISPKVRLLIRCATLFVGTKANRKRHEILLTIRIFSYNMLLSERMYNAIKLITMRINRLSSHCATVTYMMTREAGRARDVYLQIKGNKNNTDSCEWLINSRLGAYIRRGVLTCECRINSHARIHQITIDLYIQVTGKLHGVPIHLMSDAELTLRMEALLNVGQLACITYEPKHTARLHKMSSFISGPSSADICKQVKQKYGPNFHIFHKSCVNETKEFAQRNESLISSFKLEAKEPLYAIDESLYLEKHAQLLYDINEPYLGCEYNGYMQVEQLFDAQMDE